MEEGSVLFKETIAQQINGYGHYESLNHYAEVHLKLEPLERGKGLKLRVLFQAMYYPAVGKI